MTKDAYGPAVIQVVNKHTHRTVIYQLRGNDLVYLQKMVSSVYNLKALKVVHYTTSLLASAYSLLRLGMTIRRRC